MRIILASKSPRRKELLDLMGIKNYEIIVSNADETHIEKLTIEEESKRLSYIKAKSVFDKTQGDRIVIGSDTMVIKDNKLYEKPKDEIEAVQMLRELKNGKSQVITSLAVIIEENRKISEVIDVDITDVYITDMTDEEIFKYVSTGNSLDKAGAYAIQSEFCKYIEKLDGNYTTVVGLPIQKLYKIIKEYL